MRKTKIVATLGPASEDPEVLRAMIEAGLDVARFNFSHGDHESHLKLATVLRNIAESMGKTVALLADTKGPEIRVGEFQGGSAELIAGSMFTLTSNNVMGNATQCSVSYTDLPRDVKPGSTILLDDGMIELVVESVSGANIACRVVSGGLIYDRKGVNVPDVSLDFPYISSKDRSDLRFIVENKFDIIAASFVRSADDVAQIREELGRVDSKNKIRIISKIENAEGVRNAESILAASDGLMVARGDLGVEVAYEDLPIIQKELIDKAVIQGKCVITATQMLESMIVNPRPTRAEVSDVANAIYDGTGAIMLSGETAAGKYPAESIATMAKIAQRIERDIDYRSRFSRKDYNPETSITNAISHATVTTAHELNTAAILTITMSGNTARNVAKYRPSCPIIACTPDPASQRQLNLVWGVVPLLTREETDTSILFSQAVDVALESGLIKEGDLVVLTGGVPVGSSGTTNMLKVHVVGEEIFVS